MAIVTEIDPFTGEEITYDDSIRTSTEYKNGANNGTTVYSTATGLPITTPTDGNSLTSQITSLLKGTSSAGTAGQLASMVGIGTLLNSLLGNGTGGYAGFQGKIPQFTANRQQYATPQMQSGYYAPNLPANATAMQRSNTITPEQLTQYLKSGNVSDAQIANQMNRYGITANNLAGLTGVDQAAIQQRYNQTMGPNAQLGHYRPGQGGITYFSPQKYYTQAPPVAADTTTTTTPAATTTSATPAATAPITAQDAFKATGVNDPAINGASGGMMYSYNMGGITSLGGYSDGGRLLKGPGDGVSDSIPASIGDRQPARLADGEFVVPARIVSELGNGSTDAGARKLYEMMDRVKSARSKAKNIAADTKASKYLPA
jgi:hypothetical protein